jgi:hypothetical protein
VGVAVTLCGPGSHTVWAWQSHCVGLAVTLCGPGSHTVWAWQAHVVGLVVTSPSLCCQPLCPLLECVYAACQESER